MVLKEKVEINRNNAMDEVVKVLAKLPLYSLHSPIIEYFDFGYINFNPHGIINHLNRAK